MVAFQFLPRTGHSVYYLALTFIEAIIVISLEAAVFGIFFGTKYVYPVEEAFETNCYNSVDLYPNISFRFNSPDQLGQGIPIYLIIFIFSQVFQVFLVLDAVSSQTCVPS
jgi:hypothetical protein